MRLAFSGVHCALLFVGLAGVFAAAGGGAGACAAGADMLVFVAFG